MLTPRELEVLDVVGEVMQERLQEVRKEYEGKLTDLQTKVAALEARPVSHVTADTLQGFITDCDKAVERRIAGLPPPPEPVDLTPLTERLASLEGRVPEVTVEKLRAMGDDLEEVIERRFAMLPPPPDLTPINEKLLLWDDQPSPATVLQMAQKALAEGQADVIGRLESKIDVVVLETAKRFEALPPPADPPDLTPLTDKIAALEAEAQLLRREQPDLTPLIERAKIDHTNLDNLHERVMAMEAKPPVDLMPLEAQIARLDERASEFATKKPDRVEVMRELSDATDRQMAVLEERIAALPPPADLAPITERIDDVRDHINEVARVVHANVAVDALAANVDQRFKALPLPPDIEPLQTKLAELETRPTSEEVLKLAQGALDSTKATILETLQVSIVDLFKALPIPQKGDPGDPGKSVTAEQFRDLFEASYAKFELDTERRIMDLVQRTLDRVPLPRDGVDGFGFDDFTPTFDGERTLTFRFQKDERVKEFAFTLPYPLDKSVWKAGTAYVRGDGVTWGGSWFIAQRDNPGKPEDGADNGWRLAVKHGRDGKPGTPGLKGDRGKDAKPAREVSNGVLRGSTEP